MQVRRQRSWGSESGTGAETRRSSARRRRLGLGGGGKGRAPRQRARGSPRPRRGHGAPSPAPWPEGRAIFTRGHRTPGWGGGGGGGRGRGGAGPGRASGPPRPPARPPARRGSPGPHARARHGAALPAAVRLLRAAGAQRGRAAVRDARAHAGPLPGHAARGPGAPRPLLRRRAPRVLLRPAPAQLRRRALLLPVGRAAAAAGARAARRLPGGGGLLRAGRRGDGAPARGRGLPAAARAPAAPPRLRAPALAALRVPGELAGRARARRRLRARHPRLHRRLLPRDAARVPRRPRPAGARGGGDVRLPAERLQPRAGPPAPHALRRPLLRGGDAVHLLVLLRAAGAPAGLPEQARLLQERDEPHRFRGHRALLRGAGHGAGPAAGRGPAGHVAGHPARHPPGARLPHLQAVPPLQGPADPGPDAAGLHARAGPAHLLPLHRRRALLQRRLLRRGGPRGLLLHQHPRVLLVGRGHHDHRGLRGHGPRHRGRQDRGLAVRHRRRAHHLPARARHRLQLQLLLPPGDGGRGGGHVQPRGHAALRRRRRRPARGQGQRGPGGRGGARAGAPALAAPREAHGHRSVRDRGSLPDLTTFPPGQGGEGGEKGERGEGGREGSGKN